MDGSVVNSTFNINIALDCGTTQLFGFIFASLVVLIEITNGLNLKV